MTDKSWLDFCQGHENSVFSKSRFDFCQGHENSVFSKDSRSTLGPTQPPIQWVLCALSLGLKRPKREADHNFLVLTLIVELCLFSPIIPSWSAQGYVSTVSILPFTLSTPASSQLFCKQRKMNCTRSSRRMHACNAMKLPCVTTGVFRDTTRRKETHAAMRLCILSDSRSKQRLFPLNSID